MASSEFYRHACPAIWEMLGIASRRRVQGLFYWLACLLPASSLHEVAFNSLKRYFSHQSLLLLLASLVAVAPAVASRSRKWQAALRHQQQYGVFRTTTSITTTATTATKKLAPDFLLNNSLPACRLTLLGWEMPGMSSGA